VVCWQGEWAYVINLSGIAESDVIQRCLISPLLGDELSWSSPHVEELDSFGEDRGVAVQP